MQELREIGVGYN